MKGINPPYAYYATKNNDIDYSGPLYISEQIIMRGLSQDAGPGRTGCGCCNCN